jgi:hypothetical protein
MINRMFHMRNKEWKKEQRKDKKTEEGSKAEIEKEKKRKGKWIPPNNSERN